MLGNVGILHERLISNLKSEINFLKNQLLAKDTFFRDEITFLCRQLSEALAKKVDTFTYLSSSTFTVNADEAPVDEDLANSKPEESAIRSDSKRQALKKNQTETTANSNASNNIERQRRDRKEK